SGFAAACLTCSTPITLSQPGNSPGLNNTFVLGPAANTRNAIPNGANASMGDGNSANVGLNFNRYALGGGTGAAAAPGAPKWNVWGAYSNSNLGYDFSPLSSAGNVKIYLAGVDYTFSNNVVFGVATAFDH